MSNSPTGLDDLARLFQELDDPTSGATPARENGISEQDAEVSDDSPESNSDSGNSGFNDEDIAEPPDLEDLLWLLEEYMQPSTDIPPGGNLTPEDIAHFTEGVGRVTVPWEEIPIDPQPIAAMIPWPNDDDEAVSIVLGGSSTSTSPSDGDGDGDGDSSSDASADSGLEEEFLSP